MKTKKIVGLLLIAGSLFIGYKGINKVKSDTSIEVLNLKIEASDKKEKEQGYIYLGISALMFIGGIYIFSKK